MNTISKLILKASALSAAISAAIFATIGVVPIASAQSLLMEEIVVTAQKREENLQDVGLSVTAFSGDQIKELGYTNTIDIAQQTPGLNVIQFHPTLTTLNIRGISQNDFADHLEAPIAAFIDNAYVSSQGAVGVQLFDIDRVEVLRGPQGTLFGRNATGGLIHYLSAKPTEEFEGYASFTAGNYETTRFEGVLSGGLTDNLQARLSVVTDRNDGLLENDIGPDLRQTDARAVRLQFAWQPIDILNFALKLSHSLDDARGNAYQHDATLRNPVTGLGERIPDNVDQYGTGPGADRIGYRDDDGDAFRGAYDQIGWFDREINGATLELTADISDSVTFTSISDYSTIKKDYLEDGDSSPITFFEFGTTQDFEQLSQEFRVNGEGDAYRWQAGVYYLDINHDGTSFFDLDLFGVGGGGATDFGQVINSPFQSSEVDTESWAVFTQGEYDFTDVLTLILGLRYTEDDRDIDALFVDETPALGPGATVSSNVEDSLSFENVSYKAQLDWRPADSTLIFAGVTQTHKAGNFRIPVGEATGGGFPFTSHDEEELLSYEVGIKTDILDGTGRINLTAFYYDYTDYQAFVVDPTSGVPATSDIINLDATAQGLELEVILNPVEGLDLLLGAAYMDSEVDDVPLPGGALSRSDLPYAPDLSFNGLARYSWAMFDGQASVQADFNYSDDFTFSVLNAPLDLEPSYFVVNARTKYLFPGDKASISLFVNNLTEEEYRLYSIDVSGLGFANDALANPRTYGVTVDFNLF